MSACVARMASRSSCRMKRRLKKVNPLWAFTVKMRRVFCGGAVRIRICCDRNSARHSKPRAHGGGLGSSIKGLGAREPARLARPPRARTSAQQQRIVGEFLATHAFEHV